MGAIYKAEDIRLKRTVALKFLPPELTRDREAKQRFVHEAQAASGLDHPNICTIHEIDETEDGQLFICMAYYEGETLNKRIERGPLQVGEAVDIAIQVARGLAKAHKMGIIHRDIKPSNVLIAEDGQVKILDFGLAKLAGQTRITRSGVIMGTVAYMSPEQARGGEVDHRSDIWSLGVVLYEMLSGQLPFQGEHEEAVLYSIFNERPKLIRYLRNDVPVQLEHVVHLMIQKDARERYSDIETVLTDLEALEVKPGRTFPSLSRGASSPSIAVLPFVDMSPHRDQEYFCDGMAEEIISALTHVEGLRVVARTSAFVFKDRREDVREIGRQLGVGSLLEGSVRKAGSRLRITVQLINVADGYQVWSERYDRETEDVFVIQEEISLAIVDNLKVRLLRGEKTKLLKHYTDDVEAYSLYLRGRHFWNKRTEEALRKSIGCFRHAIEIDPQYAIAHAGLSDSLSLLPFYGSELPAKVYPGARSAALKALELDETLAEAHTSLAAVKHWYDWDWEGAETEFKRAIELSPGYVTAHHWYGGFMANMRRLHEAFAEISLALELDPLSLIINANLGDYFYYARQYDDAIEQYRKTLEIDPEFGYARVMLGRTYLKKEMFEEAVAEFPAGGTPELADAYAGLGKKDAALAVLEELIEKSKRQHICPMRLAVAYVGLGQVDEAFEALERAYQERSPNLVDEIYVDPFYDDLRSDSRYRALLERMGLNG